MCVGSPRGEALVLSAPPRRSNSTQSCQPLEAATMSGVMPMMLSASTVALASSSTCNRVEEVSTRAVR